MSIEAMKQALEALEGFLDITKDSQGVKGYRLDGKTAEWDEFHEVDQADDAITALRTAIEAAEKQEPVAVVSGYYGGQCVIQPLNPARVFNSGTAFYAAPIAAPVQEPFAFAAPDVLERFAAIAYAAGAAATAKEYEERLRFTQERWEIECKSQVEIEREACAYRAGIALLGADRGLANRVDRAIRARGQ